MDHFFLRLIRFFNFLWQKVGVDVARMELILSVKLKMDNRQPNAYQATKIARNKKAINNATIGTVIASLLMGCGMLAFLYVFRADPFTALSFYFLIFVVMLAMTLITDFSSVLMDTKDNYIILSRPVNDRTVVVSRLLHIFIHLTKIIIPMSLPGMIYMILTGGLTGILVLLLQTVIASVITILLVNLVYLLLIRVTTPGRFRNMITYFQVGFAILIFGGYEFFLQIMDSSFFTQIRIEDYHWTLYTPVVWIATLWKTLIDHDFSTAYWAGSLLAMALPVLSGWLIIVYLAPVFNRKVSAMQNSTDKGSARRKDKTNNNAWYEKLSSRFIKNKAEAAGFNLGWKLTERNRDFKLKIYPILGYMVVIFFVFLFSGDGGISERLAKLQKGPFILILIYMSGIFVDMIIPMIAYADQYKAAWICFAAPLEAPGKFIRGFIKMILIKYFLAWYVIVVIVSLLLRGASFIPNLVLSFMNIVLLALVIAWTSLHTIPFSQEWNVQQNTGRILRRLLIFIPVFAIGILHYLVMDNQVLVICLSGLSGLAVWWLMRSFEDRKITIS